jgi:hypothetical protein
MSKKDKAPAAKIIGSGAAEPSAKKLAAKQADILERLQSLTPDQLHDFQGSSLDDGRSDEIKFAWEKTIWEK